MSIVHIYPQELWHDSAYIAGTREGLLARRRAIDSALEHDAARADVYANDGEGYCVYVNRVDDALAQQLALSYTDPIAKGCNNKTALHPWLLPAPGQQKETP